MDYSQSHLLLVRDLLNTWPEIQYEHDFHPYMTVDHQNMFGVIGYPVLSFHLLHFSLRLSYSMLLSFLLPFQTFFSHLIGT